MEKELKIQRDAMRKGYFSSEVQLLDALVERFGPDVKEAAYEHMAKNIRSTWERIASEQKSCDIDTLIEVLWNGFCKSDGFEYTVEEKEDGKQIYCTKCPLSDMARDIGAEEWGFLFYCQSDPHIVEGFSSAIGFRRTKTLMEGHDCCDHFYYYKNKK